MNTKIKRGVTTGALALCALLWAPGARATHVISSSTFNGTANGNDIGNNVKVDSNGNIYVVGNANDTTQEIWLGKYNASAVFQTSATIAGNNGGSDQGEGITVGSDGNIYAAGIVNETAGGDNIWVGKYDSGLTLISSASFDSTGSGSDGALAVAVDSTGVVYVAGFVENSQDIWIGRFDSDLVYLSSVVVQGSGGGNDFLEDIIVGDDGFIYVAGTINETGQSGNVFVAKYDKLLVQQLSATVNGVGNGADGGFGVAIDTNSNVYVSGFATDANIEIFIGKFDSSLVLQSTAALGGTGGGTDEALGIIVDAGGNPVVTGFINETVGGANIWLARFSPALALLSSTSLNGAAGATDIGSAITLDASGNIIIAGQLNETSQDIYLAIHVFEEFTPLTASAGGSLAYNMPGGLARLTIPAGALSSDVIIALGGPSSLASAGLANADLNGTGVALEITMNPSLQPNQFVSLLIPYRDQDISSFPESQLLIARFDDDANTWVPLFSTVDAANNTVTALTNHFSIFQIMAVTPAASVATVRAFPNPFKPNKGHTSVTLINMPALARIRLFTMAGEKVRDITANGAGVATWDARSQAGELVAPGVYYGYVQSGKDSRKTFKIAVER